MDHVSLETKAPKELDRSKFEKALKLSALKLPSRKCQEYMKKFQGYTFNKPCTKCILKDPQSHENRLLLLSEEISQAGPSALPEALREEIERERLEIVPHELTLGYDILTADQILKQILPDGCEVPSSFESVGHIAHLNIREELLPFRYLIGQVLLDKNPHLRTVVNKVGSITNEYRVFDMEVIAGEESLETEVRQSNALFKLNFREVYWNSRLEAEHIRLVGGFGPKETIVDMMAGIGPFAIPAAQKGCEVFANDLNPRSVHYLSLNARRNKVSARVRAFNDDARGFLRRLLRAPDAGAGALSEVLPDGETRPFEPPEGGIVFQHAVMNLPASAVEFLDAFKGAFNPDTWDEESLPTIHCYTFARSHESEADIRATCEKHLGGGINTPLSIRTVRNVAPSKNMMCVSFRLPPAVAFAASASSVPEKRDSNESEVTKDGDCTKKPRTEL